MVFPALHWTDPLWGIRDIESDSVRTLARCHDTCLDVYMALGSAKTDEAVPVVCLRESATMLDEVGVSTVDVAPSGKQMHSESLNRISCSIWASVGKCVQARLVSESSSTHPFITTHQK